MKNKFEAAMQTIEAETIAATPEDHTGQIGYSKEWKREPKDVATSITMRKSCKAALAEIAKEKRTSRNNLICEVLEAYINDYYKGE